MKKSFFYAGLFIAAACFFLSCKKSGVNPPGDVTNTITLPANGTSAVAASNSFAFKFFQSALQNDAGGNNKLISPLSIYLALSMVYNGADNATKDSMATALQLAGFNINDLNQTCKALIDQLPGEDNKVTLSIANSIWYAKGNIQPLSSFLTVNSNYFNAGFQPLDFTNPSSVNTINNWASANTQGKIPTILTAIDPSDVMYLLNAIYFKGAWQYSFKPSDTYNDAFHLPDGSIVNVPFMKQVLTLNTFHGSQFDMAELPYGGGNSFSMFVISPNDKTIPFNQFAANLDATVIKSAVAGMSKVPGVTLLLPKWEYSYPIDDMRPELAALGMGIAFSNGADFSKMYNTGVEIDKAIHKTYIKVDEVGTEAAAVTVIGITPTDVGPFNYFRLDHPFIYVIAEKQTGAILFTGILNDPSK